MKRLWLTVGVWLLVPPRGCGVDAHQGKLHLVIVGDRYATDQLARFNQDALKIQQAILGTAPYSDYTGIIDFKVLRNTQPLTCQYSATMARLLTCPVSTVTQVVNAAGLSYDHIIVVVNSGTYGGSGGMLSVTYNGSDMGKVIVHEWGHTFGGLFDEYNLSSTPGVVSPHLVNNCYQSKPPAGTDGTWAQGCRYPNWYRQKAVKPDGSAKDSVMKSLSYPQHNDVSKQRIRQRLEQYRQS